MKPLTTVFAGTPEFAVPALQSLIKSGHGPEIVDRQGSQTCEEGCLSVPGVYAEVERAENVRVKALGLDGEPFELDADGLLAVCIQHEIDHLDGKVFVDYLSPLKRRMVEKRLLKQQRLEKV